MISKTKNQYHHIALQLISKQNNQITFGPEAQILLPVYFPFGGLVGSLYPFVVSCGRSCLLKYPWSLWVSRRARNLPDTLKLDTHRDQSVHLGVFGFEHLGQVVLELILHLRPGGYHKFRWSKMFFKKTPLWKILDVMPSNLNLFLRRPVIAAVDHHQYSLALQSNWHDAVL